MKTQYAISSVCVLGMTLVALFASASFASVPRSSADGQLGRVTDDTALYQNLSELRVRKSRVTHFDSDLARLASLESQYREPLPVSAAKDKRLASVMLRVSQKRLK